LSHFLQSTFQENGVATDSLVLSPTEHTTLAFVSLTESGERDFIFQVGAHEKIEPDEVELPEHTFLFHFGSLTQVNSPAKEATAKLIDQAQETGVIISYDPNIREAIWGDLERAKKTILETAKRVHILKVNEVEAAFLSGTNDIQQAAQILFTDNLEVLLITLGEDGCYFKTKQLERHLTLPVQVTSIDTTGAGDAFNAGYIYAIHKLDKSISEMSEDELVAALNVAMVIAALTTTQKGAITAFPTIREVEDFMPKSSIPDSSPQGLNAVITPDYPAGADSIL